MQSRRTPAGPSRPERDTEPPAARRTARSAGRPKTGSKSGWTTVSRTGAQSGSKSGSTRDRSAARSDDRSSAQSATRGRPRDPGADERIRRAAIELLVEVGYAGMSVDAVAARAGVGKATVYRRWRSKDAMAYDALEALFDIEVPVVDTGSIEGDLTQSYADIVRFFARRRGAAFLRIAVTEAARDRRIGSLYRKAIERRVEISRQSYARAVERGEVRPDADPREVVERILGVFVLSVLVGGRVPRQADVPDLVRTTLDGIRARPTG